MHFMPKKNLHEIFSDYNLLLMKNDEKDDLKIVLESN